ncbi:biotin--[acetyl-CoA-carboxylase] ligase [filamentous cyanobacterium LEGE 07170]|nr:biotin--[acetyl-CoA-carboxylase] ligase [filamentous cyanobacterium LEGE 07170]
MASSLTSPVLDYKRLDCEPFNQQRFFTHLHTTSSPIVEVPAVPSSTFSVHFFETVASTNAEVWRLLEQGAGEGVVAIAQQQQRGSGQRGRFWQSSPGGLYLSIGLAPNVSTHTTTRLIMSCAWGIATALCQRRIPVGVKWLNDLVLDGQKLGGILIETRVQHGRVHRAVLGCGINWSNPVPDLGIALASWLQTQADPAISSLEELGAIALQSAFAGYCAGKQGDVSGVIAGYESVLVNRGQTVRLPAAQSDGEECSGKILGVNPEGFLRVQPNANGFPDVHLPPGSLQLGYPTPVLPLTFEA